MGAPIPKGVVKVKNDIPDRSGGGFLILIERETASARRFPEEPLKRSGTRKILKMQNRNLRGSFIPAQPPRTPPRIRTLPAEVGFIPQEVNFVGGSFQKWS